MDAAPLARSWLDALVTLGYVFPLAAEEDEIDQGSQQPFLASRHPWRVSIAYIQKSTSA